MSRQISCIAVDDDAMTLKIVKSLVDRTDFLRLSNTFESSADAFNALQKQPVDLIFLDIEMPDMTGLELIKALSSKPAIILISTKPKYALEAFEHEVVDYLLKPIANYGRFLHAAQRARTSIEKMATPPHKTDHIYLKVDSLLVKFCLENILWIEAFGDYVKVKTPDKVHVVYATLKSMEDALPTDAFVRIHRSYIVRTDRIDNIDNTNLQIIDKILPIGNSHKKSLMERINVL
jgi:DNA-binding LytR/AlgR family response regulator